MTRTKRTYEDYVNLKYKPKKTDLICKFIVTTKKNIKEAAGAVAAESSIGTWTHTTTIKSYMLNLAAVVYQIKKLSPKAFLTSIAYPNELWEPGNMPGILSGIAGNIFGMKEVENLKLVDVIFPKNIAKSFPGPKYGIGGVRKITGVYKRPLLGTIIKPKIGLNSRDHAKIAYEAWAGGCDIVKDDENLVSQTFNKFEKRLNLTLKSKKKAEKETGERKMYMINVTAETKEMLRRAKLVEDSGNEYIMVDIVVTGWSALQTLRNEDFKLVIHAHRAGHAALNRVENHGIGMNVIARLCRLVGCDQLHIGTVVGKMFENRESVMKNVNALTDELYGVRKTMPVSSGGLHPGHVPALYALFGKDVIIQMGGGIHGNRLGTRLGAKAARQAIEAVVNGVSLKEYAKTHKELKSTLQQWQ